MDNKVAISGKLEMDDFHMQWWLQVDVSEESLPIESEFVRICDLSTLGGNTANALLQVDVSEESLPIESEFMRICDLAILGGNTAIALL